MRNEIFPAISVNKGCHRHQQLQPPWMVSWGVLRDLRKEYLHPAAIIQQPLPTVSPEETQHMKIQDTHHKEVMSKEMISVKPGSCIFPYIEKH